MITCLSIREWLSPRLVLLATDKGIATPTINIKRVEQDPMDEVRSMSGDETEFR